jgi:TPP-dependent pyruvate/acetoin dehydrogenase alpha subunit
VRGAIERAEARMRAAPLDTFDHVYADVPPEINAQRQEFAQELEAQGGPA